MEARVERGVSEETERRLAEEIRTGTRRRLAREATLAGAARCLAVHSSVIKDALVDAVSVLGKRGAYSRALYRGGVRVLAELGEPRISSLIAQSLDGEDAGGDATLSAACFDSSEVLTAPLAHVVMRRQPHRAFAAEIARLSRGESDGAALMSIAPMINENRRIELCAGLLVPLLWRRRRLPQGIAPALGILRDAERHLGRWLVLAEVATRAGDPQPLSIAVKRSTEGASNAQAAWELIRWALAGIHGDWEMPVVRPTIELVARLSDRPSAERDTTFLFRMAAARVPTTKSMLENLLKGTPGSPEAALRAQLYLLRNHGREDSRQRLLATARSATKGPLSGLAAAALFDAGDREMAMELSRSLSSSRHATCAAWALLVGASAQAVSAPAVVDEASFRRIQLGWVE